MWGRAVPGDSSAAGGRGRGRDEGGDEPSGRDVAALSRAVVSLVDARAATVAELVPSASSLERTARARDAVDAANAHGRVGGGADRRVRAAPETPLLTRVGVGEPSGPTS